MGWGPCYSISRDTEARGTPCDQGDPAYFQVVRLELSYFTMNLAFLEHPTCAASSLLITIQSWFNFSWHDRPWRKLITSLPDFSPSTSPWCLNYPSKGTWPSLAAAPAQTQMAHLSQCLVPRSKIHPSGSVWPLFCTGYGQSQTRQSMVAGSRFRH